LDKNIPADHIRKHYQSDDYLAAVLIYRGKDGKALSVKHDRRRRRLAGEKRQAHFRAANADGADVYVTVNSLVPGTHHREKRDVQAIRHLYLDVDRDGPAVLQRILASPLPRPSTVIASSPGKLQILWRVSGFVKQEAEATVLGLALQYGADATVWDCARILRLPGFRNTKYPEPYYARVLAGDRSSGILMARDFPPYPDKLRDLVPEVRQRIPDGHHSMSEREWGQVMRKLEKGEAPALVRSWLAQQAESRGKPRPDDYAKRTVENAMRQFQNRPRAYVLKH
jgi:hypothetical protein